MRHLQILWCRLTRGHDLLLQRTSLRIYLECAHCPYASVGWEIR